LAAAASASAAALAQAATATSGAVTVVTKTTKTLAVAATHAAAAFAAWSSATTAAFTSKRHTVTKDHGRGHACTKNQTDNRRRRKKVFHWHRTFPHLSELSRKRQG
jgi:hypothetical protein